MDEESALLEAEGLRKRYWDGDRERWVIDGIDLKAEAGELLMLAGPSGSGKTTLLAILGGLATPTEGEVRVLGRSIVHMRDHHRTQWRRAHVGFVFQELSLLPDLSLMENVLLPLIPEGGATSETAKRAQELLARFDLGARADDRAKQLSGGERQRGSIVRALIHDPELLLMDEPSAHIDADNVKRLLGVLAELRDEGKAVLVSTHDPRLIEDARVDRVRRIRNGRLE